MGTFREERRGPVEVWTLDAERYPWQQTLAHVPIPSAPARLILAWGCK